jgi:acylphosphatase
MIIDEGKNRLHATVEGHVQGVSFRYFVVEQADRLNLTGWTSNLWNGGVEVVAEGPRQDLERLLQSLWIGPPMSRVDHVNVDWQDYIGEFSGFHVRSTSS